MNLPVNQIICGDCLEVMKDWPDKCVDLVLTDPPYNISKLNDNRDRSKLNSPIMRRESPIKYDFGEWDNMDRARFLSFTKQWLRECCRLLKPTGTLISFFNKEDISYLGWTAKKYGFRTRTIFTWHKRNPTPSFRQVNYLSSTEFLWIGSGAEKWTFNFGYQKDMHNFYETNNASSYGETDHPTEKPIEFLDHLLNIHSNLDDLIFDPFCGSGTTCVATKLLGRQYIGIDISSEYCKIAEERLRTVDTGVPVKEARKGQQELFNNTH